LAIYGYARVSTDGQDLAAQREHLTAAGVERIYAEKVSGSAVKLSDRRELERLLRVIGPGDVVVISKLDRLARSTRDLLNILHRIGEAGASFKSLGDAWADTTTAHGRLLLTMLGGIADYADTAVMRSHTSDAERVVAKSIDAA